MNIKKKLMAISVVLAMAASFAACSDSGSSDSSKSDNSSNGNAGAVENDIAMENDTLSPEQIEELTKHELSFEPFVPDGGVQQDAVEGDNNVGGNSSNNVGGNSNNNETPNNNNNQDSNNDNNQTPNNNNNQTPNNNNNDSSIDNSNSQPNGVTPDNIGDNNVNIPEKTGLQVISGTKAVMQAWWMDLSQRKDFVFDGEYLVVTFKIKENVADGIYPVTIEWLDFTNWDAQAVHFTGIDGAVVVGDDVEENKFNDDDSPQVMASNVSGKPGETVTVSFNIKNNPGIAGNVFRFGYNSDALEYVSGTEGADFEGHFK